MAENAEQIDSRKRPSCKICAVLKIKNDIMTGPGATTKGNFSQLLQVKIYSALIAMAYISSLSTCDCKIKDILLGVYIKKITVSFLSN